MKQSQLSENTHFQISWHRLSASEVLEELKSAQEGLTETQASERLKRDGPNQLPDKKPPSIMVIFFHQFLSPLIYILLIAAVVSFLLGEQTDAYFIIGVLLLNAALGTFQEWKAEKSAASLQNLLKMMAYTFRDGIRKEVDAKALVVGDIVFLESGMTVPADIRLLETNNLSVDEALLTGESTSSEKTCTDPLDEKTSVSEQKNMAFAGSTVMTGRATGVVVATGLQTEIGKIAKSVTQTESAQTPLLARMEKFSTQISIAYVVGCTVLALLALAQGMPGNEVFFMAVALAVAAVPEGLPVAMTIALSVASQRMAKRNVIVRKLMAVEGLGSCTCIASDKTGTLTLNKQTAKVVLLPEGQRFTVSGEGYSGAGEVAHNNHPVFRELVHVGVLCNEGILRKEGESWITQGDSVDIAFLALGHKAGEIPETVRQASPLIGTIPYESERRYAAAFHRNEER